MEKFTRIDARLYDYMLSHQPPEHDALRTLRERTGRMVNGFMQVTPEQGHLLALLVRLIGARRTLEVGVFTGYSALAVALALPADGNIVACDVSKEWTSLGEKYWRQAAVDGKIDLRIAPALETLGVLEAEDKTGRFDFAFIDAEKTGYDGYYEACLRLVRPGGLVVLDNTLRRGRVANPEDTEADTVALRQLNVKIARDDRVDRVLLPIASGMTLARRR
jgi:predicted O-methyltransferase YrrM